MPSEEIVQQVLEILTHSGVRFGTALNKTVNQVRGLLAESRHPSNGDLADATARLGSFAEGRIDPGRFSSVISENSTIDPASLQVVERALERLKELAALKSDLFTLELERGSDLRAEVAAALRSMGKAFGAGRVVELCKRGQYQFASHDRFLDGLAFDEWTPSERRLGPPIVVVVQADDLRAESLAEFLDGGVKIVLVVAGQPSVAPLIRLVTPVTFVQQTEDPASLKSFADYGGPGIAAVGSDFASFTHDPSGGDSIWQRISVEHAPDRDSLRNSGRLSKTQELAELDQLNAIATQPAAAAVEAGTEASAEERPAEPADKLAAWLMSQADLERE